MLTDERMTVDERRKYLKVRSPRYAKATRVKLRLTGLGVAKTSNLQPYLFKVLKEQDAAAELSVTLEVKSGAGIPVDVLEKRIVEGFEQLGITVQ